VDVAARPTTKATGPGLRVTWIRSTIGHKAGARGTIRALGLHRLNQTVEVADTPVMRGMLRRVAFLVRVDEPVGTRDADAAVAEEGESA
jgi:large subunit ribosomal protein L30